MLKLIKLDSNEEEDNDDDENLNYTNYEDNNLKNHSFWCSKKKLYSFLIYLPFMSNESHYEQVIFYHN